MAKFAENLKKAREEAGITKAELARRSGLSKSAITQYECGNRLNVSMDAALNLSTALGISVDDLMGEREVQKVDEPPEEFYHDQSESLSDADAPSDPTDAERAQQKARFDLLAAFDQLNPTGQTEAVNRVEEMTHVPKYTEGGEDHGSET